MISMNPTRTGQVWDTGQPRAQRLGKIPLVLPQTKRCADSASHNHHHAQCTALRLTKRCRATFNPEGTVLDAEALDVLVEGIMGETDVNNDRQISFDEFIPWCIHSLSFPFSRFNLLTISPV